MKKLIIIIFALALTVASALGYNVTADVSVGDSSYTYTFSNRHVGRRAAFEVSGDFGGGTITLYRWVGQGHPDEGNGEWVAFSGASFTDDGGVEFFTGMRYLSISLSGATSPDIDFFITPEG